MLTEIMTFLIFDVLLGTDSAPDRHRHCGKLRTKPEADKRNLHCRIQQFHVPKQTSLDPVSIAL